MKTCTKCEASKPATSFYTERTWCKSCCVEYGREWTEANREKTREYYRLHKVKHPLRSRATTLNTNARRQGAEGKVYEADLKAVLDRWNDKCAYCLGSWSQFDHVVSLSEGGINEQDNIVPACKSCNIKKSKSTRRLVPHIASEFWPPSEQMLRPWSDWQKLFEPGGRWTAWEALQ